MEVLIPDDDSVRLLSHELKNFDYSLLYQAYSAKGRNTALNPKTIFKLLTMFIFKMSLFEEKLKQFAAGILTSCDYWLNKKR